MKKYLLLYYTKTGNSKFMATKLSDALMCEIHEIIPLINNLMVLFVLSLLRINVPINVSKRQIQAYDEVIMIGPVWGG